MNEMDRLRIVSKVEGIKDKDRRLFELDMLIFTDLSYCYHEYGIRKKDKCLCLDCGDAISEDSYQRLYEISSSQDLRNIRSGYLRLLLTQNSQEAVETLKKDKGIKLVKERIPIIHP